MTPGFEFSPYVEEWKIWIDIKQDGNFVEVLTGTAPGPISRPLNIPEDTILGNTRMRVSMKWNGAPNSCGSFTYGEVEDYAVIINR